MLPPLCAMWDAVRNAEGCDVCCGDGALDGGGAVSRRHGASRADPRRLADDAAHTGSPTRSSGPPAGYHSADPAAAAEGHAPGGTAAAGPPAFRREGAVLSAGASEAGIDRPLIVKGALYADALRASQDFAERNGALQVHAYDQPETLLGQGTVGSEIEADAAEIDTLLVAAGGGGLIGGIAAWYEGRIRLVAVEPEGAPTLHNALAAGHPVDAPAGGIAADSLAPARVGALMFPLAQRFVERAVLVEDAAIREAQRRLWSALRIAAEPGGAAAMAALISGRYQPAPGERIGVVLCGANTDAIDFDRAGG